MLEGVNIEEIRQYNEALKVHKEKSSKLSVELEINEKELTALCQQLSAELGVEVTKDNIEQIYNAEVAKINQSLETGKAVLAKIAQETSGNVVVNTQGTPLVQQTAPQNSGVTPAQPVQSQPVPAQAVQPQATPVQPVAPAQTVQSMAPAQPQATSVQQTNSFISAAQAQPANFSNAGDGFDEVGGSVDSLPNMGGAPLNAGASMFSIN